MKSYNLFQIPSLTLSQEITTILTENPTLRIERIISTGQTTDWYNQAEHEFVSLLQGKAVLEWEDSSTTQLMEGDTILIPAHMRHRVSYTSTQPPCIWLCVFWK